MPTSLPRGVPGVIDVPQAADILDHQPIVIRRNCARGRWPAEKVGGQWQIDTAGLLQAITRLDAAERRRQHLDLEAIRERLAARFS